jgi:hypothetical protein
MLTTKLKTALDQIAADYNPDMGLISSGSYLGDARRALPARNLVIPPMLGVILSRRCS